MAHDGAPEPNAVRQETQQMKIRGTLCRLDRNEIEDNIDDIAEMVSKAKHICRKCARVSRKKKYLCKPVRLESKD